jgi:hypothetical protein
MPRFACGLMRCTAWASTCAVECRRIDRPSALSTSDGLDRVIGRDDGREVLQVAVDAQSDDGAVGEQGEAVGGIGHVRRG